MQQPVQLWSPNQAPEQRHTRLNFIYFSLRGIQKEKKRKKLISTEFLWYSHKQLIKKYTLNTPTLKEGQPIHF